MTDYANFFFRDSIMYIFLYMIYIVCIFLYLIPNSCTKKAQDLLPTELLCQKKHMIYCVLNYYARKSTRYIYGSIEVPAILYCNTILVLY
jgi:hypothetical protein